MRIVLVNQYFPPDTSATAVIAKEVAEGLSTAGHEVTVLAGRPSYDPTRRGRWRIIDRADEDGLVVERLGSVAFNRRAVVGRVANYASYLLLAAARLGRVSAEVVVAMTDPPAAGVPAALCSRLRRVPLVINVRDLHPDMAVAAGLIGDHWLVRVWDRVWRWALRQADLVVVLGDDMADRLAAKGVERCRLAVVRDGCNLRELPAGDHPVTEEIRQGFSFVVLHAGNLGFAGAFEPLLEAARLLVDEPVGFVFVGDGAARESLMESSAGMANVRFLPFRPAEEIPYVMAAGDLHVVTVRHGLEGLVVPSKLFEALAAGRPVLAVTPPGSDAACLVSRERCGWVADPGDPAGIAAVVREAAAQHELVNTSGERARALASRFDRTRLLAEFVRLVEDVGRGNGSARQEEPGPRETA